MVSFSDPSVNQALNLRSMKLFLAVPNRHDIWMASFDSLNLRKISDCRSFSDLKTWTDRCSLSHSGLYSLLYVIFIQPLRNIGANQFKCSWILWSRQYGSIRACVKAARPENSQILTPEWVLNFPSDG